MYVSQVAAVGPTSDQSAAVTLTFNQAVSVWLLHWRGEGPQQIATKLGTNALRVDAVLHERQHVGSRRRAESLNTH